MKKVCYLLFLSLGVAIMQVHAQDTSGNTENKRYAMSQKKFTFGIQPLQAFNNGLRYDFEIRLGNGPGWLQFGPAFYYNVPSTGSGNHNYYYEGKNYHRDWLNLQWREPYSELKGVGLDINYKHFLDARRSLYIAAGLSYARFDIKYRTKAWKDYIEDGLAYLEYAEAYRFQQIDRFGVNNFIGYQIPARSAFLFDVFGGYAVRFSFSDEDKPAFDNDMFSYGYSGIVALIGFRIGFGIR